MQVRILSRDDDHIAKQKRIPHHFDEQGNEVWVATYGQSITNYEREDGRGRRRKTQVMKYRINPDDLQ